MIQYCVRCKQNYLYNNNNTAQLCNSCLKVLEKEVNEVISPGNKLDEQTSDVPVAPIPEEPLVQCGYMVGIKTDGTFIFETVGSNIGIIELVGLHKVAGDRLNIQLDEKLGLQFSKILQKLDELKKP